MFRCFAQCPGRGPTIHVCGVPGGSVGCGLPVHGLCSLASQVETSTSVLHFHPGECHNHGLAALASDGSLIPATSSAPDAASAATISSAPQTPALMAVAVAPHLRPQTEREATLAEASAENGTAAPREVILVDEVEVNARHRKRVAVSTRSCRLAHASYFFCLCYFFPLSSSSQKHDLMPAEKRQRRRGGSTKTNLRQNTGAEIIQKMKDYSNDPSKSAWKVLNEEGESIPWFKVHRAEFEGDAKCMKVMDATFHHSHSLSFSFPFSFPVSFPLRLVIFCLSSLAQHRILMSTLAVHCSWMPQILYARHVSTRQ